MAECTWQVNRVIIESIPPGYMEFWIGKPILTCLPIVGPQLSGSCQGPSCAQAHYLTGAWSACNATCDGGVVTRSVACVDARLQPAPATACKGLTVPAAQRSATLYPRWGAPGR